MEWYFFGLMAAIFFSARMLVEKKTLIKEHALEMSTVLSIFIFILFFVFIGKVDFSISFDIVILIFFIAILCTFGFWFLAKGIRHMQVSVTSPLLNFSPAFVAILAVVFLGEKLSYLQLGGISLLVFGSYFLEVEHPLKNPFKPFIHLFKSKYTQYLFLAMILYSFVSILDKFILGKIDQFTYLFISQFFVMINFIFLINFLHDGFKGIGHGIKKAGKWIFLLAMIFIAQRIFYMTSVTMIQVSLAYPLYRVGTLFSTIIGGKLFHDGHAIHRIITCLIMIIGAALVVI